MQSLKDLTTEKLLTFLPPECVESLVTKAVDKALSDSVIYVTHGMTGSTQYFISEEAALRSRAVNNNILIAPIFLGKRKRTDRIFATAGIASDSKEEFRKNYFSILTLQRRPITTNLNMKQFKKHLKGEEYI